MSLRIIYEHPWDLLIKTTYCRRKEVIHRMSNLRYGRDGSIWEIATAIGWTLNESLQSRKERARTRTGSGAVRSRSTKDWDPNRIRTKSVTKITCNG
jgi:hypothetical protein